MVKGIGKSHLEIKPLVAEAKASMQAALGENPSRWLLVDVAGQRLFLLNNAAISGYWPVSTGAAGINARLNSGGTPPGVHRIDSIIGREKPLGTIFESRQPTGQIFSRGEDLQFSQRDLILTRILTLTGCQAGINLGPGVDSLARFIYLHGTNHEDLLGQPVSHGCIRLANQDIIELSDLVHEGDPVVIV